MQGRKLKVRFILVSEGSSDAGLVQHLENLCIDAGADEVMGSWPDLSLLAPTPGKDVASQVEAALQMEPSVNLVFIHRDADQRDPTPRYVQIKEAIGMLSVAPDYVAVVPVQELEAWLLLDETLLRAVAMNPRGRTALAVPGPKDVERLADPKARLRKLLVEASGLKGRRRDRFKKDFPAHRRRILDGLEPDGLLGQVPSWQRLVQDTHQAIDCLRQGLTSS